MVILEEGAEASFSKGNFRNEANGMAVDPKEPQTFHWLPSFRDLSILSMIHTLAEAPALEAYRHFRAKASSLETSGLRPARIVPSASKVLDDRT